MTFKFSCLPSQVDSPFKLKAINFFKLPLRLAQAQAARDPQAEIAFAVANAVTVNLSWAAQAPELSTSEKVTVYQYSVIVGPRL